QADQPATREMTGLRVVDDTTFTVRLVDSFSQFPILLGFQAFYPLPRSVYGDLRRFEEAPVGNGPYEMDGRWRHDEAIRLKPVPAHAARRLCRAAGFRGPVRPGFPTGPEHQPALEPRAKMRRTTRGITDIRFNVRDFSQCLSLVKARKVTGPFFSSWLMDYPS